MADSQTASSDSAILFRFVPGRLMFYAPFRGNEQSIQEVYDLIARHRNEILAGHAYVSVRGFCGSFSSEAANRRAAKNRSNQVKSYFITNGPLKEVHYRTRNFTTTYDGQPDVVAVIGLEYAPGHSPHLSAEEPAQRAPLTAATPLRVLQPAAQTVPSPGGYMHRIPAPRLGEKSASYTSVYQASPWYLKTNLLYDACLMPSLEVEYRLKHRPWSVALEGNIAWWHNNHSHKYYQVATVIPEVRYWLGKRTHLRGHYIGLLAGGGWYDLENGRTGYRGEGLMAGLSYGYLFPIGKRLGLEVGAALGYLRTWYEKYTPEDGHYVYQESKRMDYFGPLRLRLALVWNLPLRPLQKGGDL